MSNVQSAVTHERTLAMLRTALGPVITEALEDPKVVEVMLNPDGRLWLDKLGCGRLDTQKTLCLLYTSPSPRDRQKSRMPSSA